ncbi:hypothetical protein ACFFX0_00110 [Citricoccus parietis]|uniref:Uncharacterized protein n=1 Tax=Citricoccus parietis TaxID=592307 RepID=A0ABV5FTU5_9MICC
MCPSAMTRHRSAWAAKSRSWVVNTTCSHRPDPGSESKRSWTPRVHSRSSRVVGSSATSSTGSVASTEARARRWRCPPERS